MKYLLSPTLLFIICVSTLMLTEQAAAQTQKQKSNKQRLSKSQPRQNQSSVKPSRQMPATLLRQKKIKTLIAKQKLSNKKAPYLQEEEGTDRNEFNVKERAYPLTEIPEGAYERALQQIENYKKTQTELLTNSLGNAAIVGDKWVNLGPASVQFWNQDLTYSGRIRGIAVNPSNPKHWLIFAEGGGIWKTIDSGVSWKPTSESQKSLWGGTIAFSKSNPQIVYASAGTPFVSTSGILLRSSNGGDTWEEILPASLFEQGITDIEVNPTNPNEVFIAKARLEGLRKLTFTNNTWSIGPALISGTISDIVADPTNFNRQYAAVQGVGIYKTIDGWQTSNLVTGIFGSFSISEIKLALAPSDPSIIYVYAKQENPATNHYWRIKNAWTSTAWDKLADPLPNRLSAVEKMICDPNDSNILFVGGFQWLFKMKFNSASTPNAVWSNAAPGIHEDQMNFAWAGNRLIIGNDGGIVSTTNAGIIDQNTSINPPVNIPSWTNHNTNLSTIQFYNGSLHPSNSNIFLGGTQDNGTIRGLGADTWFGFAYGDNFDTNFSSFKPNTQWQSSPNGLGINQGGFIDRTVDGGTLQGVDLPPGMAQGTSNPSVVKCPSNDEVFLAGSDNVWKTSNFFSSTTPGWTSNGPEMGTGISAIAFAKSDGTCNTYAFATSSGEIRITSNGGTTWSPDIDSINAIPNQVISDLEFHPTNANILFLTIKSYVGTPSQHFFKITNALSSTPTINDLSPAVDIPFNAIAIDPFNPDVIYLGTDVGVWKTTDGGVSTWQHMGPETGLPNVIVNDLQINEAGNSLVAFTYGRGAFRLSNATLPLAPTGLTATGATHQIYLRWNAVSGADRYIVKRSNTPGGPYIAVGTPSGTSYFDRDLNANTTYYYVISATNITGESNNSAEVNAVPPDAPLLVSSVTASANQTQAANTLDNNISTSWSPGSINQWIRYDLGSIKNIDFIRLSFQNGSTQQSLFDIEVSNNGSNWTAIYLNGKNSLSTQQEIFDFADVNARYIRYKGRTASAITEFDIYQSVISTLTPTAPTSLTAVAASNSINLTWQDSSTNEEGYKVERSPDQVLWTQITVLPANSISFSNTELSVSKQYYYRVRAMNWAGNSPYSNISTATTQKIAQDSLYISQTVLNSMTAGQTYPVSLTIRNNGTLTWNINADYSLYPQGYIWTLNTGYIVAPLPYSVSPNSDVTFNFNVTAPATPGTYNFQWRMNYDGNNFGELTPNIPVVVTN